MQPTRFIVNKKKERQDAKMSEKSNKEKSKNDSSIDRKSESSEDLSENDEVSLKK